MPAQSGQPTDAADALEEAFMEGDKAWAKGNGDQESLLTKGRGEEMKIRHWKTLGSLVGLWTTALLLALGHFWMFKYLDSRVVDEVILSQSYIGAASIALSFLFKASLVTSLWSAFTQWLWYSLRKRETKVSTIEALTRVLYDIAALKSWDAFLFQPWLYLCAVLTWSIAATTIFPPGALVVRPHLFESLQNTTIPIYDPSYRNGNMTSSFQAGALFHTDILGQYIFPKPWVHRLAKRAILTYHPLDFPSPCGQNCSYMLEMPGPSFNCTSGLRNESALHEWKGSLIYYGNQTFSDSLFSFQAKWYPSSRYNYTSLSIIQAREESITCDVWESIYTLNMTFKGGKQDIKAEVRAIRPLPAGALNDEALFLPRAIRQSNGTLNQQEMAALKKTIMEQNSTESSNKSSSIHSLLFSPESQSFVWNESILLPPGIQNISRAFMLSNVRAIYDAVSQALTGSGNALTQIQINQNKPVLVGSDNVVSSFESFATVFAPSDSAFFLHVRGDSEDSTAKSLPSSLILQSSMAQFSNNDFTAVNLTITAKTLNDLLRDTTISLLTMPNSNRTIVTRQTSSRNIYVFARPLNFFLPYSATLAFSLIFVVIGLSSLRANGSPARVGGFLQVLCTTRGSHALNELATEAGRESSSKYAQTALKNLKVRLGRLEGLHPGANEEEESPLLGFGTAAELLEFEKCYNAADG